MPAKTAEPVRERIVELRREGKSYSQIQAETGAARAVVADALKAAGMIKGGARLAPPAQPAPAPVAAPAPAPVEPEEPAPAAEGDGLEEFLPEPRAKGKGAGKAPRGASGPAAEGVNSGSDRQFQCAACGTAWELEPGEEQLPSCPGCGGAL